MTHTLTNPTVRDATRALTRRLSSLSTFGFTVRGVHHAEATLNLLQSTPPVSLHHVQVNPKAALDLRSARVFDRGIEASTLDSRQALLAAFIPSLPVSCKGIIPHPPCYPATCSISRALISLSFKRSSLVCSPNSIKTRCGSQNQPPLQS